MSGTVIESTPEQLVLEWQNERIRFTHSHGSVESMLGVSAGDRVTVEFSPATDNAGVIIEIKRAPGEAPGEVPEDKGIIDDRGFYSAELSDAHASRFLA
ncbi:MAG TPA: hypothetical protein VM598_13115 [Bdellovibrionota bacterium]|nr:hypothetical protein [Bdellovibrionota bacterium]